MQKEKLNIDIGGRKNRNTLNGIWKVMDIIPKDTYIVDLNSCERFPLEDNSVDNYYTSHTLEHVKVKRLPFIFSEIFRTLKKSGKIRIVVPDFELVMRRYFKDHKSLFAEGAQGPDWYPKTRLGRLLTWAKTPDQFVIDKKGNRKLWVSGHDMIFDYETLFWYLTKAGFEGITRKDFGKCSAIFIGKDIKGHNNYSLYVEAEKRRGK
jgi:predicted SAM-dependent methyltransferase